MITLTNNKTNETVNIYGVVLCADNGFIYSADEKPKTARFINKWANVLSVHTADNGVQYFSICDEYTITKADKVSQTKEDATPKASDAPKVEKPKAEPKAKDTTPKATPTQAQAKEDAPKVATTKASDATEKPNGADADAIKADLLAKYGALGADVFEALCKVAAITPTRHAEGVDAEAVRAIFEEMAKESPAKVKAIARNADATGNDYKCRDFEEICEYVSDGQPVYLYGAAGCGKSHTAEQIAKALGLDFYTQSQILFAHDVKGYGDANGTFQETPFFKAFTRGGLFFIDEMDASAPEALVVLNTAIANRRYDFPIIGNVEAHPNFRCIAAGNTALTGADTEYTARAVQDASTINRFAFFEMQYEKNVELNVMAKGDKILYSFICDLRKAIAEANIQLCVSYRQTAALATERAIKYGREKALKRVVFGGRDADEIRIIYGLLKDKENVWAKSMEVCF